MTMSEADVERYARQIVIPEVGVEGQQRLLASRVLVLGQGPGAEAARCYLEAAGVSTTEGPDPAAAADCLLLAGAEFTPDYENLDRVWYYVDRDRLVSGLAPAGTKLPARSQSSPGTGAAALVRETAAGIEAAARTVALLLGWQPGPKAGQDPEDFTLG